MRPDGRTPNELRPFSLLGAALSRVPSSVEIRCGGTRVLCCAGLSDEVPRWLRGKNTGWVTAEYALLPRSTSERVDRERKGPSGRTQEIQRLIGRSLRAAVDLTLLGERQIVVDCDVIEADGGTRTASITGGWVALSLLTRSLVSQGILESDPVTSQIAAVSVGMIDGEARLDLDYFEDSAADVDMNVVMRGQRLVEVQGTAEKGDYARSDLSGMLDLAQSGISKLMDAQNAVLASGHFATPEHLFS